MYETLSKKGRMSVALLNSRTFEVSYFLVQEFLIQPLSGKIRVQMVWAVACEENISAVEDDWLG